MKNLLRLIVSLAMLVLLPTAHAQTAAPKVAEIQIKHIGPASVSDDLIRANIRTRVGDPYHAAAVDDDVRNLYATGLFYNIRVAQDPTTNGVLLTYTLQPKPRLTAIRFHGNTKYTDAKLLKKISSKEGAPLDERKLFTDSQEIQSLYQHAGYPGTEVKYVLSVDEAAGRGTATFEITETPKVKITKVEFIGAKSFTHKQLDGSFLTKGVVKTSPHWWLSWLTGSGYLRDDELEDDKESLAQFYFDHGFLDFELKTVELVYPTPNTLIVRFIMNEGSQYKVGTVKFTGNKIFSTNDITRGLLALKGSRPGKYTPGPHGLYMDVGSTFTPKGLTRDINQVEDFYGAKGYIDVTAGSRHLVVNKIPNVETGNMDLEFVIEEGQKSYIETVEIRGNVKTKDKVIRRELTVSPGQSFDMVQVRLSKDRIQGLQLFERVETQTEPTDIPTGKNLVVSVEEKNTGHVSLSAGFSSVDSLVGYVEVSQGNFDLFNPPTFTGAGQKARLRLTLGTEQQIYQLGFTEPWLMGRKLRLDVDLHYQKLLYLSPNDLYDEVRAGGTVGVTRTLLGSDFLRGTLGYTLEDIGILLNTTDPAKVPTAILEQQGYSLVSKANVAVTYDTRSGGLLPNKGQKTTFMAALAGGPLGGEQSFYKLELDTAWYFKGFAPGHVLEIVGKTGVAQAYGNTDIVPFYEAYFLGGLYNLRGFKFRNIAPRQPGINEPIGGNTYYYGSAEYSIPIITPDTEGGMGVRLAFFGDVGCVNAQSYNYGQQNFDSDVGIGIRLNLPIGPLRLDYAIPVNHDQYNGSSGRFQFGVGYTREF